MEIQLSTVNNFGGMNSHLSGEHSPRPTGTVLDAARVETYLRSDARAVVCGEVSLSYGELWQRAESIAARLLEAGVQRGDVVSVLLTRSTDTLASLLGIWAVGAVYVPLDPAFPAGRIHFILRDCGSKVLLSQSDLVSNLDRIDVKSIALDEYAGAPGVAGPRFTERRPAAGDLAYIIYTSGSTGRPKGVQVSHRSLLNFTLHISDMLQLSSRDVFASVVSTAFDASLIDYLVPLLGGASIVIAPHEVVGDAERLSQLIADSGTTVMQATPVTWQLLREIDWNAPRPVVALSGGEALPTDLAAWILDRCSAGISLYGPTETTVYISTQDFSMLDLSTFHSVPLGQPIDNVDVYVIAEGNRLAPAGEVGELCVSGVALARGYVNRPEETERAFVDNPFRPDERMYRTGDLVRYRSDGVLEFLGRLDHQVKVRGFRIELGEIEATLTQYTAVQQTVVTAHQHASLDTRLTAYYTTVDGTQPDHARLREHLALSLPVHMTPSAFVHLAAFPLTPNGKIDRKALPVPDVRPESAGAYIAPRTDIENELALIWAGLLGVSRVGVEDDFFELGGHSLLAAQVDARVRKLFGVRVSVRAVFEYPTVAGLARAVARAVDEAAGEADEAAGTTVIVPRSGSGPVPLSFAQRRLWFLQQLDPSGVQYNLWSVLRLRGRLDEQALGDAVADIVSRHEVLRTTISVEDGDPVQVIHPQPLTSMEVTDVQGRTAPDEHARAIAVADVNRPFDLRTDAPIRTRLIRLAPDEHHLVISLHHIASDAWS
ncbi:non-ribosomal peptide synthetase, partial [Streptomyces anulatus]|uniref:non-ribosomal peptide synthetase n=1 Tax=Streptomyces anulatus TaxID=1892 RepID=UPI001C26C675